MSGKKKTGRYGMELWHILVLSVVRLGLDQGNVKVQETRSVVGTGRVSRECRRG